ncbi:MAG: hypothetical protein F6J98_18300 [Moorea sp. SIO4G2]|nr:hypothetical protein [Moorena sp. SIO3E8]NEO62278.1 hypothetical protein [Moorena sp. SIO4G2]NEQ00670.1 hypothetical protein [Moorena sp. SIO3F7]
MTFELVWAYEGFVGVFLLCYRWFQGVSQLHPSMVTRYRQPVVYDPSLGLFHSIEELSGSATSQDFV